MTDEQVSPAPPQHATEDAAEPRDRLKPIIAISLATVVVLGGSLAILQTGASVNESTTARETTRMAVRALRAEVTERAVLGVEEELQAEKDFLSSRRPLAQDGESLTDAVGIPKDRVGLSRDLREAAKGLPIARAEAAIDRLRLDTARTTLRQQTLATTRIAWNTRSTQYTTVIAVLAAALFLVGFALILEGRLQLYSYALGMTIAFVVALAGLWLYLLPIPETPTAAIAATAQGEVRAARGDFEGAIGRYDEAIAIDDELAAAHRGRAIAGILAANPDYQRTRAVTHLDGRASREAVRDAERAVELSARRDFIGVALVALHAFHQEDYEKSLEAVDDAIEINADVPDVWLLKSAAELALGDVAAARSSFDEAVALLEDAEPSQQIRLLASTYLSYLEWVAWANPELADEARTLADEAVADETSLTLGRRVPGTLPSKGSVEVRDLRYEDGRLEALIRWRNLPKGTALTALEYERPLERGPWSQPVDLALFLDVSGDGEQRVSVPLERACQPTAVRADLYLDGARASSRVGPGVAPTC